jgi:hypothetical protein
MKLNRESLLAKLNTASKAWRVVDIAKELSEREDRKVRSTHVCNALAGQRDYLLVPLANVLLSGAWEKEITYKNK